MADLIELHDGSLVSPGVLVQGADASAYCIELVRRAAEYGNWLTTKEAEALFHYSNGDTSPPILKVCTRLVEEAADYFTALIPQPLQLWDPETYSLSVLAPPPIEPIALGPANSEATFGGPDSGDGELADFIADNTTEGIS